MSEMWGRSPRVNLRTRGLTSEKLTAGLLSWSQDKDVSTAVSSSFEMRCTRLKTGSVPASEMALDRSGSVVAGEASGSSSMWLVERDGERGA